MLLVRILIHLLNAISDICIFFINFSADTHEEMKIP